MYLLIKKIVHFKNVLLISIKDFVKNAQEKIKLALEFVT